jgi:hypothetical protein
MDKSGNLDKFKSTDKFNWTLNEQQLQKFQQHLKEQMESPFYARMQQRILRHQQRGTWNF